MRLARLEVTPQLYQLWMVDRGNFERFDLLLQGDQGFVWWHCRTGHCQILTQLFPLGVVGLQISEEIFEILGRSCGWFNGFQRGKFFGQAESNIAVIHAE